MKTLLQIISLLMVSLCVSCSESETTAEVKIKKIILQCNNISYKGDIDEAAKTICINGVTRDKVVTDVRYQLSEGAGISPLPEEITDWKDGQKFTVTGGDGQKVEYTLLLPRRGEDEIPSKPSKVVIGYLPIGDWEFDTQFDKIPWKYLTHVNVSFVSVKADGSLNTSSIKEDRLAKIRANAKKYGVKVLISFNKAGNKQFADAIDNVATRSTLVRNIINFIKEKQVDGFDLDYEDYDYWNRNSLVAFAKELREAKDEGMLMTCAVICWKDYSADWQQYFDYINLMSYDYTSKYASPNDPKQHASYELFVRDLERWANEKAYKAPKSKIVGGLPFYGISWDTACPGDAGSGQIRFNTILNYFKKTHSIEIVANEDRTGDVIYNGRNTIRNKCRYVMENGYGGVMIWQLLQDAHQDEWRLLNVIGEEMGM